MGNSLPQMHSIRSITTAKHEPSKYSKLKKSHSLREYNRTTSLINSSKQSSRRKDASLPNPSSMVPTDAEIIDIRALRCALSLSNASIDNQTSTSDANNENDNLLFKQLSYIHSCVRKNKGLLGKLCLNLKKSCLLDCIF